MKNKYITLLPTFIIFQILREISSYNNSIPFVEMFATVDLYKSKPTIDFLTFVMKEWLVDQHYYTAFEKMLQDRDGFYFEKIDGFYMKKHDFEIRFQDIRMTSLMQVMTDIDML